MLPGVVQQVADDTLEASGVRLEDDLLGRHVFGHTGSAGNLVWMDPQTKGFCILFTNYLRARAPWRLVHLANAVAAAFV